MPSIQDLFSKESSSSETSIIYATALSDSEDGMVRVKFDDPIVDTIIDDESLSEDFIVINDDIDDDTIINIDLDAISETLGNDEDIDDIDSDETYDMSEDLLVNDYSDDSDNDPLTDIVEE